MASRWRCMLCHAGPPDVVRAGRSALCGDCHAGLRARGLAWCCKCLRRKAQAEMASGRSWCRRCEAARTNAYIDTAARREYLQQWRAENRARIRATNRAWRQRNLARHRLAERMRYHRRKLRILRSWSGELGCKRGDERGKR